MLLNVITEKNNICCFPIESQTERGPKQLHILYQHCLHYSEISNEMANRYVAIPLNPPPPKKKISLVLKSFSFPQWLISCDLDAKLKKKKQASFNFPTNALAWKAGMQKQLS